MAVLSKPNDNVNVINLLKKLLLQGKNSKILSVSIIFVIVVLVKLRSFRSATEFTKIKTDTKKSNKNMKGNVDMLFFKRIWKLIKIVIPKWNSKETLNLLTLTVFLVIRTFLSIHIANVNGKIVKAIININYEDFVKKILNIAIISVPASFVNSFLDYLGKKIAIDFRTNLTNHFHEIYIKDMIFYQVTNIDTRISNPDQRLTTDVEKWATSLSSLFTNLTKPLLDVVLFTRKLSDFVGWEGPFFVMVWYALSGFALRLISPPFGKLTAIEQKLEGEYRTCHSDLVNHAEEIAFYKGQKWEKSRIINSFDILHKHTIAIMYKKLYMGCFDNFLVKYGAGIAGYTIVGLPVFGSKREKYLSEVKNDASIITKDYVRNSSILINLAKAIGRLIVSYKEIQSLAGYSALINEVSNVFEEIQQGKFERTITSNVDGQEIHEKQNLNTLQKGKIMDGFEYIKFDNVPITTPNGDNLIASINLEIKQGMHCIITGPNGCGKSSLFRILGSLWPLFGGELHKPDISKLFYVPQRPYLPAGNLRDQIIYPQSKEDMERKKVTDEDLQKILVDVHLAYLPEREGGFDAYNDWNDVLSGGEKQRVAIARLVYHKPIFAILDECTSAVSMDVESNLYTLCKSRGITLFTVSHRTSLFKHHNYLLRFDGEGNWQFEELNNH